MDYGWQWYVNIGSSTGTKVPLWQGTLIMGVDVDEWK